jgi:hypothetical protein
MISSTTIRSALALAGLFLALSVQPTQAVTVISTAHYQKQFNLNCSGTQCLGSIPAPGTKRQLNITRITCFLAGASGSQFEHGEMVLETATNSIVVNEYLPVGYSASFGSGVAVTLNQAVDMQVAATQHVVLAFDWVSGGTAIQTLCTATGTLDTLQ